MYYDCGGEWGPVTFPAFKAGDSSLRGWNGGFDFHAPPPTYSQMNYLLVYLSNVMFTGNNWLEVVVSMASRCDCRIHVHVKLQRRFDVRMPQLFLQNRGSKIEPAREPTTQCPFYCRFQ